ncbi:hypothetical protein DRJ17_01070 [Candidatus Woesearchaeota archaeon]|nr:MAG: hypothetical protein DRJ17_01070 [Candidatus Woesearchaeota archaeon]
MADDEINNILEELKLLSPEERIERITQLEEKRKKELEELEKKKKEDIEKAEKMIRESFEEIVKKQRENMIVEEVERKRGEVNRRIEETLEDSVKNMSMKKLEDQQITDEASFIQNYQAFTARESVAYIISQQGSNRLETWMQQAQEHQLNDQYRVVVSNIYNEVNSLLAEQYNTSAKYRDKAKEEIERLDSAKQALRSIIYRMDWNL